MPMHKEKEMFLNEVVSHVKFPFDRKEIKSELEDHIEDRMLDYLDEGYSKDEALSLTIKGMGNSSDIGRELNMMHNPFLGWIWKISDIIVRVVGVISIMYILLVLIVSMNFNNPLRAIDENEVVYHMKVNNKVRIDDRVIQITDILYETDNTMHIRFRTYSTSIFINNWNFSNIGTITDDLGHEYYGGGGSSAGILSYSHIEIDDFPEDSTSLNIVYDQYNRKFEFHFDLEEGRAHE